ncbi:MAG: hypothetical protein DSM106950_27245 [Stigonema ocellatum SAG 48.90 = DSM 106950]|nr:hypothetical protein [Stigonema ocellatum SAG 48.90 = DSM 106950]
MGSGEWGMGSREWGVGSGEWGAEEWRSTGAEERKNHPCPPAQEIPTPYSLLPYSPLPTPHSPLPTPLLS